MGAVGLLLVLFGYTLVYCGLKDIPVMQEIGYGLGLDTDPFLDKSGAVPVAAPKKQGTKKRAKDQPEESSKERG